MAVAHLHCTDGISGATLDPGDHLLYLPCGLLSAVGKRTDFVCHYCKPTALFASTRRLNGGV
ncbi:hypothetical protein D3C87_1778610 [compost metagenome]